MTKYLLGLVTILSLIFITSSCGGDEVVPPEEVDQTTLERVVDSEPYFMLWGPDVVVDLQARVNHGDAAPEVMDLRLDLTSGFLRVGATHDGLIDIEMFELYFDDIIIGDRAGLPPAGLHLTDVKIALPETITCEHVAWSADDQECNARVQASLVVSWSMVASDGVVVPLPTHSLEGMGIDVDLFQQKVEAHDDLKALAMSMRAHVPGTFWSYGDTIELGDLRLAGGGIEVIWMQ